MDQGKGMESLSFPQTLECRVIQENTCHLLPYWSVV